MSGTIGISCTTQNRQQNKNLYFKAIDVLETTYSSVKLSYLTNLDKPVNSVNVRNIEKMEPRVPEIGLGIDVGGLNFSDTSDFTPDVSLSGDTIIVNSISNLRISTSVKGTTSNKMILTSNCNGYFSFAGTINTGNNASITIKSGAKVFFYNAGKINESCRSGTVSLIIEDGAIVNFENSGTIGGVIKTSESSLVITKTEKDFDKLKYKDPSMSTSVETVNGLHILSQQFTSIDSLKMFDINNKTGEITIKEPLTLNDNSSGSEIVDIMKINENCKVICNNLYFKDGYGNISTKAPDPIAGYGSKLINNGELTVSPGTRLYINCLAPFYLEHENNGVIYNLGEIDGKEYLKGTGRIIELNLTAEVNGELYNDITVDKVNRTVTINNLTPETDYDINLIASLEPYIGRSKAIKHRTLEACKMIDGPTFNKIMHDNNFIGFETKINFVQDVPDPSLGVDVSESRNGSIIAYYNKETEALTVSCKNKIIANEDCSKMFYNFGDTSFNFDNFDTQYVKNMKSMFESIYKCNAEQINKLNTKNVEDMSYMFSSSEITGSFNLTLDTHNVRNMSYMFSDLLATGARHLSLYLNIDTSKVENMDYMFYHTNETGGEIIIMNPNMLSHKEMFSMFGEFTEWSPNFRVNYSIKCKEIAQNIVNERNLFYVELGSLIKL